MRVRSLRPELWVFLGFKQILEHRLPQDIKASLFPELYCLIYLLSFYSKTELIMPSFSRAIFDGTSESLSNGQSEQNGFPNGNGFQEKYYLDGHDDQDPIVVTGFAARLPQDADSSPGFWNLICQGRNASTNIPEDRVKMNAFYHPNPERPDTVTLSTQMTSLLISHTSCRPTSAEETF